MPSVLIVEKDISKSVQILNTINNPNLRCSGIINDITDIDRKIIELKPDILLLDFKVLENDLLERLKAIKKQEILNTKIIIYSELEDYINNVLPKYNTLESSNQKSYETSNKMCIETKQRILEILLKIGFSCTLSGTKLLASCILYSINENEECLKKLFKKVSEDTGKNTSTIKSNISTTIDRMWQYGDTNKIRKILRLGEYEKPSIKLIIIMVKYYMGNKSIC